MRTLGTAAWPIGLLLCLASSPSPRWSRLATDVSLEQAVAVVAGALGILLVLRFALTTAARTVMGPPKSLVAIVLMLVVVTVPALAISPTSESAGFPLPPEDLADQRAWRGRSRPEATHTVNTGESLWSISADSVTKAMGRTPAPMEVDPYWRSVVELNLPALKSGDADLIYPGEQIVLPSAGGR